MFARPALRALRLYTRAYATDAAAVTPTPPMLLKIRNDLKVAMRTKDTARLAVLRSILAATLNASKTASPIATDAQMLALLRKTATASRTASAEFATAGRQDLADKEDAQVRIMDEYAAGVDVVGGEEVKTVVASVVGSMRDAGDAMKMGEVLKRVFSDGGFGDKVVDKAEVAKVVKDLLAEDAKR